MAVIRRVRCPACDTEQELATGACIACGQDLSESSPAQPPSRGDPGRGGLESVPPPADRTPPSPPSLRGETTFEIASGDLHAQAARLPPTPPSSRFEDIEALRRGDKRRETALGLLPLFGPWRISRSELHTPGEKLLIGALSLALTLCLGVLAATVRPDRARRASLLAARVEREIRELQGLVEEFRATRGRLPTREEWGASVSSADARFYDPWGRPYLYEPTGEGYRVGTYGSDGMPGGAAEAADRFVGSEGRPERPILAVREKPPEEELGEGTADHAVLATAGCPVVRVGSGSAIFFEGRLGLAARCSAAEAVRIEEDANFEVSGGVVGPSQPPGDHRAEDPLASLSPPRFDGSTFFLPSSPSGLPHRYGSPQAPRTRIVNTTEVLSPGVYWGGLRVVSGGEARLEPGEYVLAGGGLMVVGTGSLVGEGLLIYNTLDPLHPLDLGGFDRIFFAETSRVRLSSAVSGPYAGVLLFQDRANPYPVEIHAPLDDGAIIGAIYAARGELRIGGRGGVLRSRLVVHRLAMQTSLRIILPPQSLSPHLGRRD